MARRHGLSPEQVVALLNNLPEYQSEGEDGNSSNSDSDYDARESTIESSNDSEESDKDPNDLPPVRGRGKCK